MKRRDFLDYLAASTGAALMFPRAGKSATSQVLPCPPPAVSVAGGSTASTSCGPTTRGPAPAWFTSAAVGAWTTVASAANQTIRNVVPNPAPSNSGSDPGNITAAWTGGGVDQTRGEYILCANGGHGDYPGNEAYAITMLDAVPAWRRLSDPTPQSQLTYDNTSGPLAATNADGRPRAMHSTFECYGDGRVWFPEQNSFSSPGGGTRHACISYNRDSLGAATSPLPWTAQNLGPWTLHPVPDFNGHDSTATLFGRAAWDPIGHKVWALGGNNNVNSPFYWSVNTTGANLGQSTVYAKGTSLDNFSGWVAIAYDLRILVAGGLFNNAIWVFYMDNAGQANDWVKVTNVTGTGFFDPGSGGVYVEANHTLAIGNPKTTGSDFYRLQIPTKISGGQVVYDASGQWSWSHVSAAGATFTMPSGGNNDTYSKWNIIEDMGNGQSAIVVVMDIAGPVYVYKVPMAGL